MKKSFIMASLFLVAVVALIGCTLFYQRDTSSKVVVAQIQTELVTLRAENDSLKQKIAELEEAARKAEEALAAADAKREADGVISDDPGQTVSEAEKAAEKALADAILKAEQEALRREQEVSKPVVKPTTPPVAQPTPPKTTPPTTDKTPSQPNPGAGTGTTGGSGGSGGSGGMTAEDKAFMDAWYAEYGGEEVFQKDNGVVDW